MKYKLTLAGKELEIEIRNLAEQANADVLAKMGDTVVLTTCVMSEQKKEEVNYFPLTVYYEEKYYAVGKIRGSRYVKRETRPSEEAVCNSRLIDRAIRPRFLENFNREVQVITTVMSWDKENDPDILGLLSASLALAISDIPWKEPIGVVRVARINDEFVLNPGYPSYGDKEKSQMDFILAGVEKNGQILINMIEGNFREAGEDMILEAVEFSKKYLKELIEFQKKISEEIGKKKILIEPPQKDLELEKDVKSFLEGMKS